jgi:hypothetical protein
MGGPGPDLADIITPEILVYALIYPSTRRNARIKGKDVCKQISQPGQRDSGTTDIPFSKVMIYFEY